MQDNISEYRKTLNRPEARHRYWHIQKAARDFFPEVHKIFQLKFHGHIYEMKINHKDDIMTGQLYEYRFLEGDSIVITKKKNGTYVLTAKDTKPYPKVS